MDVCCNEFENSREVIFSKFPACTGSADILVSEDKEKKEKVQKDLGYLKNTEDKPKPGLCFE